MGTQASWCLSLGFFLPVICRVFPYHFFSVGVRGTVKQVPLLPTVLTPLLVLCFLGECTPLVQKILVFWVMSLKSECAYMNFHVRNKRFLVQQQNSMAGARILPLPPFAGKVYNLMVIGEKIDENEFCAKSGPLSEPQCICQKMFFIAFSDTQTVLLRELGTHSSTDWSFCKYFLNDFCRQKPQVRCGWSEKVCTQHLNSDLFYFS